MSSPMQNTTRDLECGSQLNTTRPSVPLEELYSTHSMAPPRREVADSTQVIATDEHNSTETVASDDLVTNSTRTLEAADSTQVLNTSNPEVNLTATLSLLDSISTSNLPSSQTEGLEELDSTRTLTSSDTSIPRQARLPPSLASSQQNTNSTFISSDDTGSEEVNMNSTYDRSVSSQGGALANIAHSVPEEASSVNFGGTYNLSGVSTSPSLPAPGEDLLSQDEAAGGMDVTQSPRHSLAPSNNQAPRNRPNMVQSLLPKNRPNMVQSRLLKNKPNMVQSGVQSPSSCSSPSSSRPHSSLLAPSPGLVRPTGRPFPGTGSG